MKRRKLTVRINGRDFHRTTAKDYKYVAGGISKGGSIFVMSWASKERYARQIANYCHRRTDVERAFVLLLTGEEHFV